MTRTVSPISKVMVGFGRSTPSSIAPMIRATSLLGDRHRLGARAQEAGDLRGVLDQVVGLVREVHLHQHIAGKELALGVDLAAAADLDHVLGRHQDLREAVLQPLALGLFADRSRPPSSRSSSRRGRCTTLRGLDGRRFGGFSGHVDRSSGREFQQGLHAEAQDAVDDQEEQRGQHHHDDHHHRGDPGFLAAGPGDLARLGPHLADELRGVERPLGRVGRDALDRGRALAGGAQRRFDACEVRPGFLAIGGTATFFDDGASASGAPQTNR